MYAHVCVWLRVIVCIGLYMQLLCIVGILGYNYHIPLLVESVHVCRSVVTTASSTVEYIKQTDRVQCMAFQVYLYMQEWINDVIVGIALF